MEVNNQNEESTNQYIREKMKQRPLNRKKLIRRTIITAAMAVIFGVLACFTFLVLEPVFTNLLYPEEEVAEIKIPEDTNEKLPEDMLIGDEEQNNIPSYYPEEQEVNEPVDNYVKMYETVYAVANETKRSIVTVTRINKDENWWGDETQNKYLGSGLYIANNNKEVLILTKTGNLQGAEALQVTFCDGTSAEAEIKQSDKNTGLSIISVPIESLEPGTLESIEPAKLGNSKSAEIIGAPVIALGHPYGAPEAIAFGILTSNDKNISLTDSNYKILSTDIYGSEKASGILINLKGEVLGIIEQEYNEADMKNMISAFGISDLKKSIERMSNGKKKALLGINGADISVEAHYSYGVPYGAYVTGIVMNSPAMNYGIQSGDVIVKINRDDITSYSQFVNYISNNEPDDEIKVVIKRLRQQEYIDITLDVTLVEE